MVRLKSRRDCPPGGFLVTIGHINKDQPRQFWNFGNAADWFQEVARANPSLSLPTDRAAAENFVDQQNALRCLTLPGADIYVLEKGGQTVSGAKKAATLLRPLVAVADKVRLLTAGRALLAEWDEQGAVPVNPIESTRRAAICAGCPQNRTGDLTRWFTVPASETIRRQIEEVQNLDLKTPHDGELNVCQACLCPLKLKVHVPIDLIRKHLSDQAKSALDARCWIL